MSQAGVPPKVEVNSPTPLAATKPLPIRHPICSRGNSGSLSSLLFTLSSFLGRSGLFGPPLCGGSAPATPPLNHAVPHRPGVSIRNRCHVEGVQPDPVPPVPTDPRRCRPCSYQSNSMLTITPPQKSRRGRPCACPVPPQEPANYLSHRGRPFPVRLSSPSVGRTQSGRLADRQLLGHLLSEFAASVIAGQMQLA